MIMVHCGNGGQKIRWLADVAIHRYDPTCGSCVGPAEDVKFDNDVRLFREDIINEHLSDDSHVWILLSGINCPLLILL